MAGLQMGCVVAVVLGTGVVIGAVVGVTQGVSGTSHSSAETEQLST